MRRNLDVDWDARGKYSTNLFTDEAVRVIREHDTRNPMFLYLAHLAPHSGNKDDPLQAPDEEIAKFAHIPDPERRVYAGNNNNQGNIQFWYSSQSYRIKILLVFKNIFFTLKISSYYY